MTENELLKVFDEVIDDDEEKSILRSIQSGKEPRKIVEEFIEEREKS